MIWLAWGLSLMLMAYQAGRLGRREGRREGYLSGVKAADAEWALMLEMHMVGPVEGHTTHPTRGKTL